jgi:uncharacterized membrane protein YfcA
LAGVLSGTFGVGGGIIIVPALVFFLGLTQREAQGTSLLILLLPVGIFAVMNYYKQGYMKVSYALIIVVAFVVGAYLGSLIAVNLPDKTLKKIFAVFMVVVAIKMLLE